MWLNNFLKNWNIGENILQYEIDPILNVVDAKLRSYGYAKKPKLTPTQEKTELWFNEQKKICILFNCLFNCPILEMIKSIFLQDTISILAAFY